MKRRTIFGMSVAALAGIFAAPAVADDDMRSLLYILNTVSQFDRGHSVIHYPRGYHDDDDDGRRHKFHHRRFSRDDDDDDRGHRGRHRGRWNDDDD
ncbi:hypothetical protein D3P04_17905 [Paracoccus onubensis]|uniref:Uncharacterized protein n=1 Tax=Paracoccus onubensis TaxID=1675788 RepID=A0A418SPQ3_9RHOB|nr:hypothetical protein D3P04_17905 [Paracoccus onubensis]